MGILKLYGVLQLQPITCIVSGGGDETVRVWSLVNITEEYALTGHAKYINCAAITNDNKYAVSGSGDATLRLWNLEKKTEKLF
jgi:WD40 repeat protein